MAQRSHEARPSGIEELTEKAANFEYNSQIPLRYWLRTAQNLQREALIYEADGNEQQAYLLLLRHAILVLDHLSQHPQAKDSTLRPGLGEANKAVNGSLRKLEVLKPIIKRQYDKQRESTTLHLSPRAVDDDGALNARALAAGTNRELAVKLHQSELQRRHNARYAQTFPNGPHLDGHRGPGRRAHSIQKEAGLQDGDFTRSYDLMTAIEKLKHDYDSHHSSGDQTASGSIPPRRRDVLPINYPRIPPKSTQTLFSSNQPDDSRPSKHQLDVLSSIEPPPAPPQPPAKIPIFDRPGSERPPPVPKKDLEGLADEGSKKKPLNRDESEMSTREYTFAPSAYLESGEALRTVFLPPQLRHEFVQVARPNTERNLETCGFMCGTLLSNALFISQLVIPQQESTSDTCEMIGESDLFDYCDDNELMVLGWIHTHPTQTCFMSSRDLHTHAAYQAMMAESVAIVCAPAKDPSWGCFRLTDPPGMKTVLTCNETGIFHPHAETDLYVDSLRPGHVFELPGLAFETVDLRTRPG